MDKLPEFHQRLRGVQVEQQDFRAVLKRYDCPEMLWYADPAYLKETRSRPKLYRHEMSDDDHRELVELLLGLPGRAVVSGYAHPLYGPLETRLAPSRLRRNLSYRRRASDGERLGEP